MSDIPAELRERPQWVCWAIEERVGKDGERKPTKVPKQPGGGNASSTDPATWATFGAVQAAAGRFAGIGYVFAKDDPYTGVDLDAAVTADGELHPACDAIVQRLDSYAEWSPSGTGVHSIVLASKNGFGRCSTSKTAWGGKFECYDRDRFFTFTGKRLNERGIEQRQDELDQLLRQIWPSENGKATKDPAPKTEVPPADPEVIERWQSHSWFGRMQAKTGDQSDIDFAIACYAVEAGADFKEICKLVRAARTARCPGDEKAIREDYLARTAQKALEHTERMHEGAQRISKRWNLADPIVSGETIGDVASGAAIVYLYCQSGRRLRFPSLGDLFEPRKHTRIVSTITRSRFAPLSNAEAVDIAQLVIELCGGQDEDPHDEARLWVIEFIALAGATVNALEADGTPKNRWAMLSEYERTERELPRGPDVARHSVIIQNGEELWLPAGKLKEHSGSRISWDQFTVCLAEIGWRKEEFDVREPTTREGKVAARRVHRKFYVGVDR